MRSLWPREHGTYAQLAAPLVPALFARGPTLAAGLIALAAAAAFCANEPLRVARGLRGERRRAADGPRARARLSLLVALAVASAGLGLALAPAAIGAAALVAVPAALALAIALRGAAHTAGGELVAATALSGASVPVAVAAGASLATALALWAAWSIGFAASVVAVHAVIARNRRPASWRDAALAVAFGGVAVAAIALAAGAAPAIASAAQGLRIAAPIAPLVGLAAYIVGHPPPVRRLRGVGIAFAIASAIAAAVASAAGA